MHCRVRIYLPDDIRDAPVMICSELPNNPGGWITNSAEVIAAGVIGANELPTPLVSRGLGMIQAGHFEELEAKGAQAGDSGAD